MVDPDRSTWWPPTWPGRAAIGLFLSTLTVSSLGAITATVGVTVVSSVLNALPQLAALRPWLFTHWLAIGDLVDISAGEKGVWNGLVQQGAYAAGFLALSRLRLRRQDILTWATAAPARDGDGEQPGSRRWR